MRVRSAKLVKHVRRRIPAGVATVSPRLFALTDARTGEAHLVTDEAMVAGRRDGGRYVATCGVEVLPASLTAPDRRSCLDCAARAVSGTNSVSSDPSSIEAKP